MTKLPCRRRELPNPDGSCPGTQCLFEFAHWGAQGRRQSEEKAAQQRNGDGKEQHTPIELYLVSAWQSAGPELHKRADTNGREQNAEHASGKTQHCALCQALAHQPALARSERDAHGQFTLARNRAGQEQTGHIDAGNLQHQADCAQ